MKKHNFNAGPSILPDSVIEETKKALDDFYGSGVSLACTSHRSKEFESVVNESVSLLSELLGVPSGYHVLFLQGGASLQFCMLPYNILKNKAVYFNTGVWASKAAKEAKLFGNVVEIKGADYFSIPKDIKVDESADYFHFTTNNTIYGTQIRKDFDLSIPVCADMSSDILSRPVDVSKYAVIYGGAQKNMGPSGVTFVIIKDDILGKVDRKIPAMLDYKQHIENNSLYNTPSTLGIFGVLETLKWVKREGGIKEMEKRAAARADKLYNALENNPMFVAKIQDKEDRSKMNLTFVMREKYVDKEKEFLDFSKTKGIIGIGGHRSVGGFRASLYNALPMQSVDVLVDTINEFTKKNA